MTQDQYGQSRGTGYVAGDEDVPGDQTVASQAEPETPMTRLKKVASALRGDRQDQVAADPAATDPAATDPAATGPAATDPAAAASAGAQGLYENAADTGETAPGQATAVTYPDLGTGAPAAAQPGQPAAQTRPDGIGVPDAPATVPDISRTTAPADTTSAPDVGRSSQAVTETGYGSQAVTGAGYRSPDSTTPDSDYGSQAGTVPGYAGTAPGYGTEAGTATTGYGTGPAPQAGTSAAPGVTGPDTAVADAGLRPGEATDRLGDFGDIAFGNLLEGAEQYTAQWQQIQFRFVDDPEASVTEAAEVISAVTDRLQAAIEERKRAIEERQRAIQERASALRGRWGEGSNADTETLRETLRMYRAFMDQLIGATP